MKRRVDDVQFGTNRGGSTPHHRVITTTQNISTATIQYQLNSTGVLKAGSTGGGTGATNVGVGVGVGSAGNNSTNVTNISTVNTSGTDNISLNNQNPNIQYQSKS